RLLRPGSITPPMLENLLGCAIERVQKSEKLLSPGMLESHYAPTLPVRLNATDVKPSEALLAFGNALPGAGITCNISGSGNLQEAAANLFRMLRHLDAQGQEKGLSGIAVMSIPDEGPQNALGLAINDRLTRASAPR
ncbi:MAG: threonylcarbamoyl-AMP synthase, partial [Rickettsiales bacterium]|nr:threonylcarbamoyl-AMP synthase [Rickettsiales bacterium]